MDVASTLAPSHRITEPSSPSYYSVVIFAKVVWVRIGGGTGGGWVCRTRAVGGGVALRGILLHFGGNLRVSREGLGEWDEGL